jgi:hypothetical protein
MNVHLTPDMLINRAPHKPLSPFKVRRRGANAFWDAVKQDYPKYADAQERTERERDKFDPSYHAPKTARVHAGEQITGAFILGWKDRWVGRAITEAHWLGYMNSWQDCDARVEHLRAAYINGREFYDEQFPGVGPQDPELVRPSAYAEAAREAA